MSYVFKILPFLIDMDQNLILNWFKIKISTERTVENSTSFFLNILILTTKNLYRNIQNGLTLSDIENTLIIILFIRFIFLIIKYNLKTSFYITCIGIFAGYLWYRHLIDLVGGYSVILIKLPYLKNLGIEGLELLTSDKTSIGTDKLKLGNDVAWYAPFQIFYYAFKRGILNLNFETGFTYYIDPLSMYISNLNLVGSNQEWILGWYYKIYNVILPQIFGAITKLFNQTSGLFAYTIATRIGKRYCPYFIRWHWTFLFIIGFIEQVLVALIYRMYFFENYVLIPQTILVDNDLKKKLLFQADLLQNVMTGLAAFHLGLILLALFHALIGQYFYFPIVVENAELHIGRRLKNSIYSGGYTPWQKERKSNVKRFFPKLWYGWFGHQTNFSIPFLKLIQKQFKKIGKIIKKNY